MLRVIVVGGGIGGMVTALSLHAAGITDVRVYESAPVIRELGVGITVQPHAVEVLAELGLLEEVCATGVELTEVVYFTKRGQRIWAQPRGIAAGQRWPQLAIHRGQLLGVLHRAVLARLGAGSVRPGHHLVGLERREGTVWARFADRHSGALLGVVRGDVLVGADGVHSTVRRLLHPDEGPAPWGGITMWRGTTEAGPFLGGQAMAQAGYHGRQVVVYPIRHSPANPERVLINWVVLFRLGRDRSVPGQDWNDRGRLEDVLAAFSDFNFDWLDIPALFRGASGIYQYPLIDHDPLPWWGEGPITLLGDAAHPMYPYGGNGAAQAILDARALARALARASSPAGGLAEYEAQRRLATTRIVLANRQGGPEECLDIVERRAPDGFNRVQDVISTAELAAIARRYQQLTGTTHAGC